MLIQSKVRFQILVSLLGVICGSLWGQVATEAKSVSLRAIVSPILRLESSQGTIRIGAIDSRISKQSHDAVLIEARIHGTGALQTIRVPLSIVSNVRNFTLQAKSAGGVGIGSIRISPGLDASLLTKQFRIGEATHFALALDQPVHGRQDPMTTLVEIEFDAIPIGQVKDCAILINLQPQS